MGLSKEQTAILLGGLGKVARTVSTVYNSRQAEQQLQAEKLRQEERADLLRTIQDETEQRKYERRLKEEQDRYERRIREADDKLQRTDAINEEKTLAKEKATAAKDAAKGNVELLADPDKRFSLYLRGEYEPKTERERVYFEGKMAKLEPKEDKTDRPLTRKELYLEWRKEKKADPYNARSFKDYVTEYQTAMQEVGDPSQQEPSTGNPVIDFYNKTLRNMATFSGQGAGRTGQPGAVDGEPPDEAASILAEAESIDGWADLSATEKKRLLRYMAMTAGQTVQ